MHRQMDEPMASSNPFMLGLLLMEAFAPALAAAPDPREPPAAHGLSDIALLNRVTWGANEASLAKLRQMGAKRWLDWQLHPTDADHLPAAAQAQIDAMPFSHRPL